MAGSIVEMPFSGDQIIWIPCGFLVFGSSGILPMWGAVGGIWDISAGGFVQPHAACPLLLRFFALDQSRNLILFVIVGLPAGTQLSSLSLLASCPLCPNVYPSGWCMHVKRLYIPCTPNNPTQAL
jgi:hypothetical protein